MNPVKNDPTKNPRLVFWGGWYGSRNIGDRLLILTITDLLHKVLGPFDQIVLTAQPDLLREYFRPTARSTLAIIQTRSEIFRVLRELTRCHLFIFGGAVPFFEDSRQLVALCFFTGILKLFKRPYLLWCVSSLKIQKRISKRIIQWVVEGSQKITCRDQYTICEFALAGVKKPMEIVADSAFTLHGFEEQNAEALLKKYATHPEKQRLFALSPRTLYKKNPESNTHYLPKTMEEVNKEICTYATALDWLVEHGYQPIFIPMNTQPPDDDRLAAREIIQKSVYGERAFLIDEIIPPKTAPALFSYCAGSLVSRVHGSVTSTLGSCPVVMYAFENKHKGIMESMGLQEYIFDPSVQSAGSITGLLESILGHREAILAKMKSRIKELKENAEIPAAYAREIILAGKKR